MDSGKRNIRFYSRDAAGLFRRMGKGAGWAYHALLWQQYCEPVRLGPFSRNSLSYRFRKHLRSDPLITRDIPNLLFIFEKELNLLSREIRKCGLMKLLEDYEVPVTLQKSITLRNPGESMYWKLWLVFDRTEVCRRFLFLHEIISPWEQAELAAKAHNRLLNLLAHLIAAYRRLPPEVHELFMIRGSRPQPGGSRLRRDYPELWPDLFMAGN